jgi:hypothetical protein
LKSNFTKETARYGNCSWLVSYRSDDVMGGHNSETVHSWQIEKFLDNIISDNLYEVILIPKPIEIYSRREELEKGTYQYGDLGKSEEEEITKARKNFIASLFDKLSGKE